MPGGWPRPPADDTVPGRPGHVVALRPLTVGDILDGIFKSLRASFGRFLGVILLIVAPFQLLSSALLNQVAPGFRNLGDPMTFEGDPTLGLEPIMADIGPLLSWALVVLVAGLIINVIVAGALTAVAAAADRGQDMGVGDALRESLSKLGATLGATVLVLAAALGALLVVGLFVTLLAVLTDPLALLLLLPFLLVIGLGGLVLSYLVIPVAMEEGRGAWTTFRRSLSLLRHRFGYVVGISLLILILLTAVTFGLSLVFLVAVFALGQLAWIAESVQAILSSLVSAPVTALAAWLIHRDARVRLEAYDLMVRHESLGGGPAT